jgi:hypothetical protein
MRLFALLLLSLFGTRVDAQSSEAILKQVGTFHVASITQFTSFASLQQLGTGNVARLEQAEGSSAQILQNGTGNLLAGIETSTGVGSTLLQASQIESSTLLLSQIGTDNLAFVQQASSSYASITQSGIGNTVTLIQN